MPNKMFVGVNFYFRDVVVGADLKVVEFAYDNKFYLIKNRDPYHHSYDGVEDVWAEKIYKLHELGLAPFASLNKTIRIQPEEKIIKISTNNNVYLIGYQNLHLFDDYNVRGMSLNRKIAHYRVIDWFDCQGLYSLGFDDIETEDKFVNKIKFFKTPRIDGDQKYLDLLCESFLNEEQLKNFDYSDTVARFKITDLLKKHGIANPRMSLWKRDIYPVYK